MAGTLKIIFSEKDFRNVYFGLPDPMWETLLGMHILASPPENIPGYFRIWQSQARGRLNDQSLSKACTLLHDLAPPNAWYFPDFLTPIEARDGLDAGLDALHATPTAQVHRELRHAGYCRNGDLPAWTRRLAAGEREAFDALGNAYRLFHRRLIEPSWSRIEQAIDVQRSHHLQALAWGVPHFLDSLPGFTWNDPVLSAPYPMDWEVKLGGHGLVFVPSYFCHGKPVALVDPAIKPSVVVFPVRHAPTTPAYQFSDIKALADLIGTSRARVMAAVEVASAMGTVATTGMLADRLGITASAASGHLKVLRNAGLVDSQRSGPHVLHTITAEGTILLATSSTP